MTIREVFNSLNIYIEHDGISCTRVKLSNKAASLPMYPIGSGYFYYLSVSYNGMVILRYSSAIEMRRIRVCGWRY
jgi:hypothetical protein